MEQHPTPNTQHPTSNIQRLTPNTLPNNKEQGTKNKERYIALLAVLLFTAMFGIYWLSIPHQVNTIPEFRNYFDSDGEFIVRQFRQGKTYTHNDHLLYHVSGKLLHDHGAPFPGIKGDPLRAHKLLSALSGATGVCLLFLMGLLVTRRWLPSLLASLMIGGCAGWWFFSATIDTYMPCLAASILALGLALLILHAPRLLYSGLLGGAMGLAFLLRTDGFLLLPLAAVLLATGRSWWKHLLVTGAAGAFVAAAGYMILAHTFYDVPWTDVPAWALGHLNRPEAGAEKIWGVAKNLHPRNFRLMLVNQLFYSALLPDLDTTRDFRFYQTYVKGAWIPVLFFLATCLIAWWHTTREAIKGWKRRHLAATCLPFLALLWFIPRTVFYTWWDPYDPFLFAVMSLPALWLILLPGMNHALGKATANRPRTGLLALFILTVIATWAHNLYYLVDPIRELCTG